MGIMNYSNSEETMLTKEQEKICKKRLIEHRHDSYDVDLYLSNTILGNFRVNKNVFRPDIGTGIYLARFLSENRQVFQGKNVIDMGCGTGLQAIVMGLQGANVVVASDISSDAYLNTKENISKFSLNHKVFALHGDLFEPVSAKYDLKTFDLVVFNHPFFGSAPYESDAVARAWMDDGSLIHRFFSDFNKNFNISAKIIMPYFFFAGSTNDPGVQAAKHGLDAKVICQYNVDDRNILKGTFAVYDISRLV
jgi:tRNA G10  N-methylase Trm11